MELKIFEVGPFMENTYLLIEGDSALLVDPGFSNKAEYQSFKSAMTNAGAKLEAIVLTHAHVDHVLGLQQVLKEYDVTVYLNTDDLFLWENFGNQSTMFGLNQVGFSFVPAPLPKDGNMELGVFSFKCIYTPGHSPDHEALYFEEENILLAGDALFHESIGRTDLYKGDLEVLKASIQQKLFTLNDHVNVYPGHGPSTTIGHEKKNNPFVTA